MSKVFSASARLVLALAASALLAACGGKSPIAPSAAPSIPTVSVPSPAGVSNGATIAGAVVGLAGSQGSAFRAMGSGGSVSVMGTNITSSIDDSGHFELHGVPSGDARLQIANASSSAMLILSGVSEHEQIRITIHVSGSTASTDDMDRETNDSRVEVEGRITSVNGSALTVAGRGVSVPSGTPVHRGSTAIQLSSLRSGDRVHIHGVNSGATVSATDVEVEDGGEPEPGDDHGNNGPGDDHGNDNGGAAELKGTVAGRHGSCPGISFSVGGTNVVTDGKTVFRDTTCSSLADGDRVQIKGTTQNSTTVLAASVEKK